MKLKAYKTSISAPNEISSEIIGITSMTYGVNLDWTMELPEVDITMVAGTFGSGMAVDDKIIICDADDTTKQIMFYIEDITYDYAAKTYTLRCPHILAKLADYKVEEISFPGYGTPMGDWSDVTPSSYAIYNQQLGNISGPQGEYVWVRCYVQAIFLLKMLIHRVTGYSVADIDDSKVDGIASFYDDAGTTLDYDELGLSTLATTRMGCDSYADYTTTDYIEKDGHENCLTLFGLVCAALGCYVNIWQEDYAITPIAQTGAPADAAVLGRRDEGIVPIRKYAIQGESLDRDIHNCNVNFGEYDDGIPATVYYEWGGDSPDVSLATRTVEEENTAASTARVQSITLPRFFRLYRIEVNESSGYQSDINFITNIGATLTELSDWMDEYYAFWDGITEKNIFTKALTSLTGTWPRGTLDPAALKIEQERWG
jgi:hypothetical protein